MVWVFFLLLQIAFIAHGIRQDEKAGWFIIVCRRWRLPKGETSLQAYRDEHPQ